VADFIILDILIVIFSIPVITIGPAMSAAYYVALKEVRDEEGYLLKSFWKAFKQNFRQGFIIELIIVAAGVLLYYDISVTYRWAQVENSLIAKLLFYILLGFMAVVIAATIYIFPMLAKFENKIKNLIINSFLMAVKHLPQTIVMVIITVALFYYTFTYPPLILFTIGLSIYVNSFIMVRIFDIYNPQKEHEHNEDASDTESADAQEDIK
jgi:uncharacterized membrane protein YesL